MTESVLSQRLRLLRDLRRLSRPAVERLAGLGSGTLKTWESGTRTPRGPALLRLLDVLEATDLQRAELIVLADPHHARLSLEFHSAGPPIELGVVLRAFRFRKGWTQAEAARAIGVTQGAVAHWEAGERHLEGPALHQALFTLGATLEEIEVILSAPHRSDSREEDPYAVMESIDRIPGVLREPYLLANERTLWWRALQERHWEVHLLEAMTQRAIWYAYMRRFDEIAPIQRRIREIAPDIRTRPRPFAISIVLADARFRPNFSANGAARRLEDVASNLTPSAQRAWSRATQAVALATLGERRSITIARQAMEEGSQSENPLHESWNRAVDLAEVHLRLGEPEQALEALGSDDMGVDYELWKSVCNPSGLSVRALALAALGLEPDPRLIQVIRSHAATDRSPFFEYRLEQVEQGLAAMRKKVSLR